VVHQSGAEIPINDDLYFTGLKADASTEGHL
jgi:hypothetical protein